MMQRIDLTASKALAAARRVAKGYDLTIVTQGGVKYVCAPDYYPDRGERVVSAACARMRERNLIS